jgi:hypothetical protein
MFNQMALINECIQCLQQTNLTLINGTYYCDRCVRTCKQCTNITDYMNDMNGCHTTNGSCNNGVYCMDCNPVIYMTKDVWLCMRCMQESLNIEHYKIVKNG